MDNTRGHNDKGGSAARFFKECRYTESELADYAAARFKYCPKASKRERNHGLGPDGCKHPTVKPIALMRWLVRMVTPPGGVVLDPFAGSGTTGIACKLEGMEFIGMELSEEYCELARARVEAAE